jgi:hypothetical protein
MASPRGAGPSIARWAWSTPSGTRSEPSRAPRPWLDLPLDDDGELGRGTSDTLAELGGAPVFRSGEHRGRQISERRGVPSSVPDLTR